MHLIRLFDAPFIKWHRIQLHLMHMEHDRTPQILRKRNCVASNELMCGAYVTVNGVDMTVAHTAYSRHTLIQSFRAVQRPHKIKVKTRM